MILTFHKVAGESLSPWWITNDMFGNLLDDLAGKVVVPLGAYDPADLNQVVITFDGPYKCILDYAVPELKRRSLPFEAFVIGDVIGATNSFDSVETLTEFCSLADLRTLKASGGNLQWHTRSHVIPEDATILQIEEELTVPTELLTEFHDDFKHFAYPHGSVNEKMKQLVKQKFTSALAFDDGDDLDQYNLKRTTVFPDFDLGRSSVTVFLMNYNYRNYCLKSYQSVVEQTVKPDRFFVIDDSSTDGSIDLIRRFMPEAEVIINEKNLGIVDNFNQALDLLETDYALFLGADNYLHPSAIQALRCALDQNPRAAVAYFDMIIVGPLASKLAESTNSPEIGGSLTDGTQLYHWQFPEFGTITKESLRTKNFINGSSMFRSYAFREVGGYQKSYPEDHNLWLRMIDKGYDAVHVPLPLLYYRQHSVRQANTVLGIQAELLEWRRRATELETAIAHPGSRAKVWLEVRTRNARNKLNLWVSVNPSSFRSRAVSGILKILRASYSKVFS